MLWRAVSRAGYGLADLLLDLVGGVIHLVLDARHRSVDLALALQLLVISEVASRFLRSALRLIDAFTYCRSSPLIARPSITRRSTRKTR
jgi:hypothetical protein